jgi:hypothetical protein
MSAKDWISILLSGLPGVFIAIFVPWLLSQHADWISVRHKLLEDFQTIYEKVELISKNPHKFNTFTFRFIFVSEVATIKHYADSFYPKKKLLEELAKKTETIHKEMILIPEYEELLLEKGSNSPVYNKFLMSIQSEIESLSSLLLS